METKNNKKTKPKRKYTRTKPHTDRELANLKKGRDSKFKSAEEVKERIEGFFKYCEKKKIPPTVGRLALFLGFNSRNTLLEYEKVENHKDIEEKEKIPIADAIKKAKLEIEIYLEENLIKGKQVAGTIFNLKNNYNWIDRQDFAHTGDVIVNVRGIKKL